MLPRLVENRQASANIREFAALASRKSQTARVLIVGGATIGAGIPILVRDPGIELIETDITVGPRTQVVCDAKDLPFGDGTFSGCVIQAVLDDVLDPPRCVGEIERVLADDGVVYAETPFLYPVHNGPYDVQRFTHVGHRWLFRDFEEIRSGPTAGPATAFAVAFEGFLIACFETRALRIGARITARVTAWWLKYLDRRLARRKGSYDYAIGYYFLGRKSRESIDVGCLRELYRGQQRAGKRA